MNYSKTFDQCRLVYLLYIGCGPGSEIAAILIILRINVRAQYYLHVLGVDQYGDWNDYLISMNKLYLNCLHHKSDFRKCLVNATNIETLPDGGLCIMSYTDATVHCDRIWKQLRNKYPLVMLLDQRNPDLPRSLLYFSFPRI